MAAPAQNRLLTALSWLGYFLFYGVLRGFKKRSDFEADNSYFFKGRPVRPIRTYYEFIVICFGGMTVVYLGVALGVLLLSAAIGPILGMIVGGLCAATLGVSLVALFAKHSARLVSALFYHNETNPTNPDKYRVPLLTNSQQLEISDKISRSGIVGLALGLIAFVLMILFLPVMTTFTLFGSVVGALVIGGLMVAGGVIAGYICESRLEKEAAQEWQEEQSTSLTSIDTSTSNVAGFLERKTGESSVLSNRIGALAQDLHTLNAYQAAYPTTTMQKPKSTPRQEANDFLKACHDWKSSQPSFFFRSAEETEKNGEMNELLREVRSKAEVGGFLSWADTSYESITGQTYSPPQLS